jgi:glycosyltransferase 2 family protein
MKLAVRRGALGALRVAVIAAAVVFLVRGVAWAEVAGILRGVNLPLLAGVVLVNGCMMTVKAGRLRLLLRGIPSFKSCFLTKLTTSAINNVMPFRGGDMARVWMLERHAMIPKSAAAAVAVVEALFELLALAVVAFLGALVVREQRWAAGTAAILLGAAIALIWALRRMNGRSPDALPAATGAGGGLRGRLRALRERMEPGIRALAEPGTITTALLLSLGIWALEVVMVMLCARAIHLSVGPALGTLILLGINLAMALPSMPASAGAFEGGATLVLMLSGIAKGPAVAFALLYHVVQIVPVTIVGFAVISKVGLTLDRLPVPRSVEVR